MNTYTSTLIVLLDFIVIIMLLRDCFYNAKNHKEIWLVVIIITGVIGYLFFYFSGDRAQT